MLMTHYREPIDFTQRRLEEANTILRRWQKAANGFTSSPQYIDPTVVAALSDDLDFGSVRIRLNELAQSVTADPEAGTALSSTIEWLGLYSRPTVREAVERAFEELKYADIANDADALWATQSLDLIAVNLKIEQRLTALEAKDFTEADLIRADLAEQGIALMDYKDDAGQRRTKWDVKQ
jgi:cysteinyl-tRNA synthetase